MSDELRDEVEAINSIYGEGSLTESDDDPSTYIFKLPGEASSLRLKFPDGYPAEPPTVLGTNHSSGGKKGAGARDLKMFTEALGNVFEAGVVCLFDAAEEFSRRFDEEVEAVGVDEQPEEARREEEEEETDLASMEAPPWTLSEPVTDNKSTFIAHVAPVSSPAQAALYVQHLIASDKRIRTAAHNMTAWRIRGNDIQSSSNNSNNDGDGPSTAAAAGTSYQDCDDDGEAAAGGRLLHLMQVMGVWDAVVVVTRWFGGVKLGPRRFALINGVARDAFVRAGFVEKGEKERRKGK